MSQFNINSLDLSKEEKSFIVAIINKNFKIDGQTVCLTTKGAAQFVLAARGKNLLSVDDAATHHRVALMLRNCTSSDLCKIK